MAGIYTSVPLSTQVSVACRRAAPRQRAVDAPWADVSAISTTSAAGWGLRFLPLATVVAAAWYKPISVTEAVRIAWRAPGALDAELGSPWDRIWPQNVQVVGGWQSAEFGKAAPLHEGHWPSSQLVFKGRAHPPTSALLFRPEAQPAAPTLALGVCPMLPWGNPDNLNSYSVNRWQQGNPHDQTTGIGWTQTTTTDTASKIPWGAGTRLWPPLTDAVWPSDTSKPGTPPPAPDIEDAYTMATDLTVTTYDPDNPETPGTPLKVDGVRLSLDLDSFAWSLTCRVLDAASMALCLPPALIKVSTMGYDFVFLCERYSTTYAVGTTWQLSGSSRTRQIDKPWATPTSHLETNAISFKQACEACLPGGFSIEWDAGIQDWTIPANGWSYNNQTPKAALADLLTAAGLVMIPDLAAPTQHIQPRYKRAPWEYADDEADAIIAEAMMLSESGDYQPGDTVNGVWISGTTDAGVIVEVTRSGTAGDQLAADQQHDVITDPVAGQQWGKQIIAASGNKTLVTLETIITDEAASPGLLLPGMIVEVQTALETWRGLVLSCDLSNPGSPRITQTVTIERSGEAALS